MSEEMTIVPVPPDPRIAIATAFSEDYSDLAEITVPLMQAYADKWGHRFFCAKYAAILGDRIKIDMYRDLYSRKEFDVFMWIDVDALVMNSDVQINRDILQWCVTEKQHFLWGWDVAGPNTGVYFARFTDEAHQFLHVSQNRMAEMGWADNVAMLQTSLLPPHNQVVAAVPGKIFNSMLWPLYGWDHYKNGNKSNEYVEGDFILHFAGIPHDRRVQLAREYAQLAK